MDSILTPFQAAFLKDFFDQPEGQFFFLTGGTALSEFYLKHRYSDDLDFFTLEKEALINLEEFVSSLLKKQNAAISSSRKLGAFNEFIAMNAKGNLKLDFIKDIPVQFGEKKKVGKVIVDSIENIASNKICAILGRTDIKDYVDLYFILEELKLDFNRIFLMAREKDSGLNEFYFAGTLLEIKNLELLPRMIKTVSLDTLKTYFTNLADTLFKKIKPAV